MFYVNRLISVVSGVKCVMHRFCAAQGNCKNAAFRLERKNSAKFGWFWSISKVRSRKKWPSTCVPKTLAPDHRRLLSTQWDNHIICLHLCLPSSVELMYAQMRHYDAVGYFNFQTKYSKTINGILKGCILDVYRSSIPFMVLDHSVSK